MNLDDGTYFSPDGGDFEAVGGRLFWADGSVSEPAKPGEIFGLRCLPSPGGERISLWTNEKRAAVLAESTAARERAHREEQECEDRRNQLRASAAAKLTEDEREACDL